MWHIGHNSTALDYGSGQIAFRGSNYFKNDAGLTAAANYVDMVYDLSSKSFVDGAKSYHYKIPYDYERGSVDAWYVNGRSLMAYLNGKGSKVKFFYGGIPSFALVKEWRNFLWDTRFI